ncbi:uncharacterized protein LOC126879704 [Diabrotica virgifera virgifera]|uniref:Organic cation/carnitine transporter 7-like n=1 Tax=Diabrotica virgifera virgifera TaxID=50390 RepID=A0A6P7G7Z9_DIAVI|nr:uncharacterized protein LOC126879704 [Diabrotica virgifera virgifera]
MAQNSEVILYFEDVLPKTGWGLYYKFMLGMAYASYFANSTTLFCVTVAIPLSTCETKTPKNILYAIFVSFTTGRYIGGLVLNCLCDIFGRKKFISHSLVVNFGATFIAAFAFNYYLIILAVVFLGSSFEHQKNVVKIHLAEILPKKKRGHYLAVCDLVWTLGFLLCAIITYFLIPPSYIEHRVVYMKLTTWRMLFAISGGLNLILACASSLLEESPRYFLHVGKDYLALLTLKQFYAINRSLYGNSFELKETDITNIISDYGLFYHPGDNGFIRFVIDITTLMLKTTRMLFFGPFLRSTLILLTVNCVLNILSLVNINILLSKLVTSENVTSGLELAYVPLYKNNTFCPNLTENKLFFNFFMISTNSVLAQLVMVWLIDRIQRRILLFSCMALTGLSFIVLYHVKDGMTKMILSSFVMFFVSIAVVAVSVVIIEVYPTALRGTAHGVLNILGIFLCLLLVTFYHMFYQWILIILGTIFVALSCLNLWLRDYSRKPMVE